MRRDACRLCGMDLSGSGPAPVLCPDCHAAECGRVGSRAKRVAVGLTLTFFFGGAVTLLHRGLVAIWFVLPLVILAWALLPWGVGRFRPADPRRTARTLGLASIALVLLAGMVGVAIHGAGTSREWTRRSTEALAAATNPTEGAFRIQWEETLEFANRQGKPEWIEALRADLDRRLAAELPGALAKIGERERAGAVQEALTGWKGLWAVHHETAPSPGRPARQAELQSVGRRLSHASAIADLDAGRWPTAFLHHAAAAGLCADLEGPGSVPALHADFTDRLTKWVEERRPAIESALASGSERKLAAAASPMAALQREVTAHDEGAGKGGCPKALDAALAAAIDRTLAAIPRKPVAILVTGDEAIARKLRSLCRFSFPYELQFDAVARPEDVRAEVRERWNQAWAAVELNVDWSLVDYFREAGGVQFAGTNVIPEELSLEARYRGPTGVENPWPALAFAAKHPAPANLKIRKEDIRWTMDRYRREAESNLRQKVDSHLSALKAWTLPDPDGP